MEHWNALLANIYSFLHDGVWAHRWFNLPIERPKQKNLSAWYERLTQREPYQTHIMIPVT